MTRTARPVTAPARRAATTPSTSLFVYEATLGQGDLRAVTAYWTPPSGHWRTRGRLDVEFAKAKADARRRPLVQHTVGPLVKGSDMEPEKRGLVGGLIVTLMAAAATMSPVVLIAGLIGTLLAVLVVKMARS